MEVNKHNNTTLEEQNIVSAPFHLNKQNNTHMTVHNISGSTKHTQIFENVGIEKLNIDNTTKRTLRLLGIDTVGKLLTESTNILLMLQKQPGIGLKRQALLFNALNLLAKHTQQKANSMSYDDMQKSKFFSSDKNIIFGITRSFYDLKINQVCKTAVEE